MSSDAYRWQAGMGAITGALVADSIAQESASWTPDGMAMIDIAEDLLRGTPLPIDLSPAEAIAAAVGLTGSPAPLLVDPTTVAMIDLVRQSLEIGRLADSTDPIMTKVIELASGKRFVDAIDAVGRHNELAPLVGAAAGLDGGLGAVPARLVSTFRSVDGRRGRRYFGGLTNRLLNIDRPNWYDPRRRRGPREVMDGLWLSNLYGVSRFTSEHPEGLVLSLCDEEGHVDGHPHHLTFHLDDTPRTDANPRLSTVIDEVLGEISGARSTSRPVLVHCRHGASRTGLILRLLLVDELGLSADDALIEARCLWPHTSDWNLDWMREVDRRAGSRT